MRDTAARDRPPSAPAPGEEPLEALVQRELFDHFPFNLAVVDRDLRIVKANENFGHFFGDWRGRRCHEVYKGQQESCSNCRTLMTFEDGRRRVTEETGRDSSGRTVHYVLHLVPLFGRDGGVKYVLEMSRDITESRRWQREYDLLFDRVPCYISVIDRDLSIIKVNAKFRQTFGEGRGHRCYRVWKRRDRPCDECPAAATFGDGLEHVSEQVGIDREGRETHYVVTTTPLTVSEEGVEYVMEIATDITALKQLEGQKLETERLAAVGQTVAGLAHTIKNLLMGLEGGMYMMDTGIKREDRGRIEKGWSVLQRNFSKTTDLVRGFLSFAKGREPELQPTEPNAVVSNLMKLYQDTARRQGVEMMFEPDLALTETPLDPEGIEACLTNLVSNGIDAAMMRPEGGGVVTLSTRETDGELIFEVRDNGVGMDMEVKQKLFTTFFTTKGGEGTGLGLLTTRKIVQEHGGRIEVQSSEGEGSTFTIRLPRRELERAWRQQRGRNGNGNHHGESER